MGSDTRARLGVVITHDSMRSNGLWSIDGRVSLTPAYDIVSTLPYGDTRMALSMEGRDNELRAAHFIAFGERVGVRSAATRRMLETLVRRVSPWAGRVAEIGLAERPTAHLERTMRARLTHLTPGR